MRQANKTNTINEGKKTKENTHISMFMEMNQSIVSAPPATRAILMKQFQFQP